MPTALLLRFFTLSIIVPIVGCAFLPERNPAPESDGPLAEIPGIPNARFWGDEVPELLVERLRTWDEADMSQRVPALFRTQHIYLAISGGGQNGAFGAGLLNGWTESGKRPEFTVVTGISTGALSAPFAFLGPDYDDELKRVYTTYNTEDLIEKRAWSVIATGDSAADTTKLRAVIDGFLDEELIRRLAAEQRRGRRLFIGTAFIDAGRPVIWDLTTIAASGHPSARKLIGDVLLASASIPGAFPPVLIEVERDGRRYDEMHVDGGTAAQVFIYPSVVDWQVLLEKLQVPAPPKVYVIRNAGLRPRWEPVEPRIYKIAGSAISSLIRTQGLGDLTQIYLLSQRDGAEFYLAYVPDEFREEPDEPFDRDYMIELFERGYEMARAGYPWERLPPAIKTVTIQ